MTTEKLRITSLNIHRHNGIAFRLSEKCCVSLRVLEASNSTYPTELLRVNTEYINDLLI